MGGVVEPRIGTEVSLAGELRGAVLRQWPARIVLRSRTRALAVDGTPGRREDNAGADVPGCLEDVYRAEHVDRGVERRVGNRYPNVGLGGEMDDPLGSAL